MKTSNANTAASPGIAGRIGGLITAAIAAAAVIAALTAAAPQRAEAFELTTGSFGRTECGLMLGDTFTKGGNTYKVIDVEDDADGYSEVALVKYGSSKTRATVNTVTYRGETFEVDRIAKNAFNNAKGRKVTSLTIGRNVDYVGAKAFYRCKKLKVINMRASDLIDLERTWKGYHIDEIDIARTAFNNAGTSNLKVYCGSANKSYQKAYGKALQRVGLPSTLRVVR